MNLLYLPQIGVAPTMPQSVTGQSNDAFVGALFDLLADDPGQKRAVCIWNETLARVAVLHCEDMATRGYFSHEAPDGSWPNKRVRDAGYRLPSEWPDNENYVESICAGQPTPQEAWNAWLSSPSHSKHVLGLDAFFSQQTNVGLGYYHLSGSHFEHYWCAVTAPVETSPEGPQP